MARIKNRKVPIIAALLVISMIATPVIAQPIFHESGPNDWITAYYRNLRKGFWADFEGQTFDFRVGISEFGGPINPFGAPTSIEVTADAPMHFLYDLPFGIAYDKEACSSSGGNTVIHPDQKTRVYIGFLDFDHKGYLKLVFKYKPYRCFFQFKLAGDDWSESWIRMNRKSTVPLSSYAVSLLIFGTYTLESGLEGYFFGGITYYQGFCDLNFQFWGWWRDWRKHHY